MVEAQLHEADEGTDDEMPDEFCDWLTENELCEQDLAPRKWSVTDAEDEHFTPLPYEVKRDAPGWVDAASASLEHNGFCVVRNDGSAGRLEEEAAVCEACAASAHRRLTHLQQLARSIGLQPRREVIKFAEVCSRTPGGLRYDMRLPLRLPATCAAMAAAPAPTAATASATPGDREENNQGEESKESEEGEEGEESARTWAALHATIDAIARPVLTASGVLHDKAAGSFRVDSAGCVTSLPGAPLQHFHPDGTAPNALVNAFMPLVAQTFVNGPTELRPGTQVWCDSPLGPEPRWDASCTLPVAPLLAAGDLLLFNYRTYHRGQANHSEAPRPVAYLVYAREGVSDSHNFPTESLVAAAADAALPAARR